jgi:DNA repair protein RadC
MTSSQTLRPREKIAQSSIQKLSNHELLQALIGSGNRAMSVKKLARAVERLYRQNNGHLTYALLHTINGLGAANAARLVAAFELARRWQPKQVRFSYIPLQHMLLAEQSDSVATILCDLYNAAHELIDRLSFSLAEYQQPSSIIRAILVQSIATEATGAQVGIIGEYEDRKQHFSDVLFSTSLKMTLSLVDITLQQVSVLDASGNVMEVSL